MPAPQALRSRPCTAAIRLAAADSRPLRALPFSSVSSSSATVAPKTPRLLMPGLFGSVRLCDHLARLSWCCGWCCRRHFQKNSLMSGTLMPPEMYSTDLSYIVSTVEPTNVLAAEVGQLDLHLRLLAGLYSCCDGSTSTFSTRFSGGTTISFVSLIDLAVGDRHRFDEEVRHVLLDDGDLLDRALALQPQHLRRQIDAVGRAGRRAARCCPARSVLICSLTVSPGLYSRLSGISSTSLKRKSRAVEAVADDREEVAAFDRVLLGVGQLVRQAILARLAEAFNLLLGACPSASVSRSHVCDRRFDRLRSCRRSVILSSVSSPLPATGLWSSVWAWKLGLDRRRRRGSSRDRPRRRP